MCQLQTDGMRGEHVAEQCILGRAQRRIETKLQSYSIGISSDARRGSSI